MNVTDWPKTEGFSDEATVVVVLSWFTTCVMAVELLPASLVSSP